MSSGIANGQGSFNYDQTQETGTGITALPPRKTKIGDLNLKAMITIFGIRTDYLSEPMKIQGKGFVLETSFDGSTLNWNVSFTRYPL